MKNSLKNRILPATALAISLFGLSACGGGSGSTDALIVPSVLTITATPLSVVKGNISTYTFTATNINTVAVSGIGFNVDFGANVTITQRPQFGCTVSSFSYSSSGTTSITFGSVPAKAQCQLVVAITPVNIGVVSPAVSTVGNLNINGSIPVVTVTPF